MTSVTPTFLSESRRYLCDEYPESIHRAVEALTDEQVWWRPNEVSNSVGNLILHLTGNVRQWIVAGIGRQPNERDRQQEFDERTAIPSASSCPPHVGSRGSRRSVRQCAEGSPRRAVSDPGF